MTLPLLLALATADTTALRKAERSVRFTGDAGYVSTSGNSSVQTLNLGYPIVAKVDPWTFNQQFVVVHGRSKGSTTTSLWRGMFRADLLIERTMSIYGSVNYERNVFAGLASRVSNVAGVSAVGRDDSRVKWTVEGGLSLTAQRAIGTNARDLDFLGGRAASSYTIRLGPKAQLGQSVELLPNFRDRQDLRVNSESSLLAPITQHIGVKLSFVVRYDGRPEVGYLTTDRLFTSGIQVTL